MALVGDPDDRLDLLDRPGLHHRGSLVVVPALEPERIPELGLALLGRQDVLGADDCCKVARAFERFFSETFGGSSRDTGTSTSDRDWAA